MLSASPWVWHTASFPCVSFLVSMQSFCLCLFWSHYTSCLMPPAVIRRSQYFRLPSSTFVALAILYCAVLQSSSRTCEVLFTFCWFPVRCLYTVWICLSVCIPSSVA
jgi:hypothetical protein